MRLRKEDYLQKRVPQVETEADSELEVELPDQEVQTEQKMPQNRIRLDLTPKKLMVALALFAVMFVVPAVIFTSGTSLFTKPATPAFSETIVEPEGQVAGVSVDLGDTNSDSTNTNETPVVDDQTQGEVAGISTSDSNQLSGLTIAGLPIGTALIVMGLLLVMVPVVILLKA